MFQLPTCNLFIQERDVTCFVHSHSIVNWSLLSIGFCFIHCRCFHEMYVWKCLPSSLLCIDYNAKHFMEANKLLSMGNFQITFREILFLTCSCMYAFLIFSAREITHMLDLFCLFCFTRTLTLIKAMVKDSKLNNKVRHVL